MLLYYRTTPEHGEAILRVGFNESCFSEDPHESRGVWLTEHPSDSDVEALQSMEAWLATEVPEELLIEFEDQGAGSGHEWFVPATALNAFLWARAM